MLARLWHHAFVGGDDEQRGINAADACQHIFDEVTMTGDIHHANGFVIEREPSEAEINRHLALAFFFESIWMNAGEGVNQRGLAVIHMTGGADDAHD